MALVQAYQPIDFSNISTWYGTVTEASSNRIVVSAGNAEAIYTGSFYYDYWGDVYGSLTGYEEIVNGTSAGRISQFTIDANYAATLINSGDSYSLVAEILRGHDTIYGSSGSDTLYGFSGNDVVAGGGGSDYLWGDSGFDYIDGGAGYDVAFYLYNKDSYVVTSFQGTTFVSGTGAEPGVDQIVNIEELDFADGSMSASVPEFDALNYIASYKDLVSAFGFDAQAAFMHYAYSGVYEGREISFDGLDYIASYRDLMLAFGADAASGVSHYIANGSAEGRTTTFDSFEYIASHGDLINAFGADAEAGAGHYIQHGYNESRVTDAFDAEQYLANYWDLQAAFGNDLELAAWHYIVAGFGEGRVDEFIL